MIWIFFEDVNDGSVMELCFLEEIGEGIYEQLAIYIFKKKKKSPTRNPETDPITDPIFRVGSGRVSSHNKPDQT